nr:MAG TPA: hypothetical protein [Bacteriophage sp.]
MAANKYPFLTANELGIILTPYMLLYSSTLIYSSAS